MLTLAVPKGRLLDPLVEHLKPRLGGLARAIENAGRSLVVEEDGFRVLLLKGPDVPTYVAEGVAACGVAGLDELLERGADVLRLLRLPFGECRLCLIARQGETAGQSGRPVVLASKYPRLAASLAERRRVNAEIIPLAGSVELGARLGLADAVLDVVETGRTLRQNGLYPVEEWLRIRPYLICNRAAFFVRGDEIRALRRTLGGEGNEDLALR